MTALPPWENADRVRIGRLRVPGGAAERTSLRLGLAAVLDRADLRPPGLPPAAVLIVRRMGDPLPGRLAPHAPFALVDAAWQRAARERLAGLCRSAARPGREAVPADAEAVAFADDSELLASLALDIVRGAAGERWWWRNLDGLSAVPAPSLAALLRDRAVWVPAALSRLAQQDWAVDIVRALSAVEALAVLTAVGRAHGADALSTAAMPPEAVFATNTTAKPPRASAARPGGRVGPAGGAAAEPPPAPSRSALPPARPDRIAAPPATFVAGDGGSMPAADADEPREKWRTAQPPWLPWLPNGAVPEGVAPAQSALLGVALVLHRRPEVARSAGFAAGLQRWAQQRLPARPDAAANRAATAPPPRGARPGLEGRTTSPAVQAVTTVPSAPSAAALPSARGLIRPAPGAATAEPAPPLAPATDGPAKPGAAAPDQVAPPPRYSGWNAAPRAREAALPVCASPAGETPVADWLPGARAALENGVETALGGVLFLVNLMSALELPGCFEDDWRLASAVGAWGVLATLGRALLAPDHGSSDPIWAALAALSGAARASLGAGLPRRARYRLPAPWVVQISAGEESGPHIWAARGRALRLWSGAGYLLSETLRDAFPALAQASHEAQHYGSLTAPRRDRFGDAPLAALSERLAGGVSPALARWLRLVVPFIRWRLGRALGIDPAGEALADALLARPGRLYVTSTHVDLVMSLETVSLPVRLAGLDRSPGWLSEFGRVMLFHFE